MDLQDLLCLLVEGQSSSDGSSELGSQENWPSGRSLVEISRESRSLLAVEGSEVPRDVLSYGFDLGELSGAAG